MKLGGRQNSFFFQEMVSGIGYLSRYRYRVFKIFSGNKSQGIEYSIAYSALHCKPTL
jgi:hypothetical protein